MPEPRKGGIAIVDYGLGNLFSVRQACARAGMAAWVTSEKDEILESDAVILPGVGAFGDAMAALRALDLVEPLREHARSGKPLFGICLGMQLLMSVSYEYGEHRGLGIIDGAVPRFDRPMGPRRAGDQGGGRVLKVPHVGWNRVFRGQAQPVAMDRSGRGDPWRESPLAGLREGVYMYFVHSYYVRPEEPQVVSAVSRYGDFEFCSALRRGNVFACQFHPERSGPEGLRIYENLASCLSSGARTTELVHVS
jgi:glutamine amidotransferase